MDPLSLTLAVISLTSTVKSLVEFGRQIHESFAKVNKSTSSLVSSIPKMLTITQVSNNLRNAQRVAEEIKEMVEEICVFCEHHENALADMKDFRLAMQSLVE